MLRQQIVDSMKEAMRAKDTIKLGVMRFLLSEIKNQEIDAKHELADEEVITLLRREVKRRNDAIAQFEQGNRNDLAESEKNELLFIAPLLPKQLSREEIESIVDEVLATGERSFGLVMKAVVAKTQGNADGKMVSDIVKAKLA